MKQPRLVLSCSAALVALVAQIEMFTNTAAAQSAPAISPPPLIEPSTTDAPAAQFAPSNSPGSESDQETPLGHEYESQSAGVAFKPPVDCKLIGNISSKYLAEWADADRDWTLKLGKMVLDHPTPLVTTRDIYGTKDIEGILDKTIRNLKAQLPGSKILRQDVTNTQGGGRYDAKHPEWRNNVGLIAIRYTTDGKRRLSQQAIIQSSDGVYYLLTLTSPGSNADAENAPEDPRERIAADTFGRMVDSVRLLDRRAIKEDQDIRLYNTRAAFVNWTPARLHSVLLSQQWVRILKNGKDIGYTYITEDQAGGIPRPLHAKELQGIEKNGENVGRKTERELAKAGDGILIGVSARLILDGVRSDKTKGPIQSDSSSWFFVSADKKHEDFSRVVVTDDHKAAKKGYVQEFGVSEKRVRRMFEKPQDDATAGVIQPDRAPIPVMKEDWELDVTQTSISGNAEPLTRKLPPWYVPQAITHLLPRLLPTQKPQGYLFATYVSDAREVVMRYVDVLPEQRVSFAGQYMRAIPIQDRLGLAGSVTLHYMSVDGTQYFGSENKDQQLVMLPTDEGTLRQIWQDAKLTKPSGVDRNNSTPVSNAPQGFNPPDPIGIMNR